MPTNFSFDKNRLTIECKTTKVASTPFRRNEPNYEVHKVDCPFLPDHVVVEKDRGHIRLIEEGDTPLMSRHRALTLMDAFKSM